MVGDGGRGRDHVCPAAGTRVTTSLRSTTTALGGEGLDCRFQTSQGATFTQHGVVAVIAASSGRNSTEALATGAARLWPLAVGKEMEVSESYNGQPYAATYRVVGYGDVTVQAGTFAAWQIEVVHMNVPSGLRLDEQIWWAPSVGVVVKRTARQVRGNWDFGPDWEVMAVRGK